MTGCYAQTDAEAVARIPGVDLVLGNREKYRLPDLLGDLEKRPQPEIQVGDLRAHEALAVAPFVRVSGRSRAFVKIQDGCQHRCAFCIVPAARGESRSQEPKVVLDQVRDARGPGYGEITLTGVDIGHYGRDLVPRHEPRRALVARLAEVSGLRWLRLSSVLPAYWTRGADRGGHRLACGRAPPAPPASERQRSRAPPHAPPVQSPHVPRPRGAARRRDARSRARHRPHRRPSRREDDDFAATLRVVGELPFSYLHVFAVFGPEGDGGGRGATATCRHA